MSFLTFQFFHVGSREAPMGFREVHMGYHEDPIGIQDVISEFPIFPRRFTGSTHGFP